MVRLDVRIALFLVRTTRMGYGPSHCRPNLLGILPKRARRMIRRARPPFGFTFRKLRVSQFYVKCAGDRVDLNDVAIPQEPDRPAHGRLRSDMADAETAGCPGKPAVGDQCDLAAGPLPGQRSGGRQHLPHARPAAGPLVADDDDFTFPVGALLDSLEGVLLTVEAAGRPAASTVRRTPSRLSRSAPTGKVKSSSSATRGPAAGLACGRCCRPPLR